MKKLFQSLTPFWGGTRDWSQHGGIAPLETKPEKERAMKNAHERFGTLEFTKRMKDTTTEIRLRLDRVIAEVEEKRNCMLHLISVVGGDSDVGAIWGAVNEQSFFTICGPEIEPLTASLGEGAQCLRGTLNIAGRKPFRHLVAISSEMAKTRPGADPGGQRTVLCDDDAMFVLYRVAQRFGLPVVPEWAGWFREELGRRGAIKRLVGQGCRPVLVTGTKKMFLKWIGTALRQKRIPFPEANGPVQWRVSHDFFRVSETGAEAEPVQLTSGEDKAVRRPGRNEHEDCVESF